MTQESLAGWARDCHGFVVVAMDPAEFRTRTRFVIKLGRALHECGTTSQRVEQHLTNVTRLLGLQGSFLMSPTTFTCAFWEDDELDQFIHIERVEPAENNLGRLWEIDRLVESIAEGRVQFCDGIAELDQIISAPKNYSPWVNAFSWMVTGASFSALVSSGLQDCVAAAVLSLILFFVSHLSARYKSWDPLLTILAPFVSGVLAVGAVALGAAINVPFVILSSIIVFIPGLALTIALTEISAHHLISGGSRLLDAVMLLLKLFFGAISGIAVANLMFHGNGNGFGSFTLSLLPAWKTWPALIGLSIGLGIVFNIPRRKMFWGLLSTAIAFGASSIGESWFGMSAGMFVGALAVGLFSNLYSRITRGPGSILMIQGFVLLVPGSKTYMILNHWVSGVDVLPGANSGNQALMVFLALITGLLFSNALIPPQKSL